MKKYFICLIVSLWIFCSIDANDWNFEKIKINRQGTNFKYWNKNSKGLADIKAYVKDVTSNKSPHFIPVKNRVATFDVDGTILSETAPYYMDYMALMWRLCCDKTYVPSDTLLHFAQRNIVTLEKGKTPASGPIRLLGENSALSGMSLDSFERYARHFLKQPVVGFKNMVWGESFYLPMLELISYLQANQFSVFLITGSERQLVRILIDKVINIPKWQVIGSRISIVASNQGNLEAGSYQMKKEDVLLRGNQEMKNLDFHKVANIVNEIGVQPVLAFGNSPSDACMLTYCTSNNPYSSKGFLLLADDNERDYAKDTKNVVKLCKERGWHTISMREDFSTIYGYNVEKTKKDFSRFKLY